MSKVKDMVRRGTALAGAVGLLAGIGTSALPSLASADTLNPLTKRSLTLSSSSPGWSYTDGSGNSTYAAPNTGANGKQTGNVFAFHNSTANGGIKAMSFQYCTTSAGKCWAPGDDATPGTDTSSTSDLNYVANSPAEVGSSDFGTVVSDTSDSTNPNGDVTAVPGVTNPLNPSDSTGQFAAHSVAGNFLVMWDNGGTWTQDTGWTMSVRNVEDPTGVGVHRGTNNYLVLTKTSPASGLDVPFDTPIKVLFFGTTNNYLTNPGSGAFFVKINTYNKYYKASSPGAGEVDVTGLEPAVDTNVIDGGVTVANVMNQSIQITTKVLETMDFSVGTVDPDTLDSTGGATGGSGSGSPLYLANGDVSHGPCDGILRGMTPAESANVLQLGDQNSESALSTTHTYSTHSYWRLSSNSSGGATVYYSGHTLSNTEGDQINPVNGGSGASDTPHHGEEQFGLALDNGGSNGHGDTANAVSYAQEATYENADDNSLTSIDPSFTSDNSTNTYHDPQLYPLAPTTNYGGGTGAIDGGSTTFAFDKSSDTIPAAIATESSQVVDCVTGKIRYMANIAATTPAGIYTTKINYIAAPQY